MVRTALTSRLARLAALAVTLVGVTAVVSRVTVADASGQGYILGNAGLESGGGNLGSQKFGLDASAGQTGLGDATGGNYELAGGASAVSDACPNVAGLRARQGCDLAAETSVELHVVDQAKSGACRSVTGSDASSCSTPLADAKVKVFDRNRLNGLTINVDGKDVTLTKNPDGSLYDDIYGSVDSQVLAARAALLGCVTTETGRCVAGLPRTGDHLVIMRWETPAADLVHTGLPYGAGDFVDTDGDGTRDLVRKSLNVVQTVRKDGTIVYTGGSKTIVTGSYLHLVRPDRVTWDGPASGYLYPFALTADSPWKVQLCATLPAGYAITGIYDEDAGLLSGLKTLTSTCVTRSIDAGEGQVVAFDVQPVGLPVGEPTLSVLAKTWHNGTYKEALMTVPGVRSP